MTDVVYQFLFAWKTWGARLLMSLGLLGLLWVFIRWYFVEHENPLALLHRRFEWPTRWLLQHRRSPKVLPLSLALLGLGAGMFWGIGQRVFILWAYENGLLFLAIHAVLAMLAVALWATWDREPKHVKKGVGLADTRFRDVPEDWGIRRVEGDKTYLDPRPTAEILVYRSPSRLACRLVGGRQHREGDLTLLSLRWDILSQHVFVVGPQGSGKTASFYAPIMYSSLVPWIYQDSKAELPFRESFKDRPVFGLDVRGYATRSLVWNPLEEIRSAEDFDLLVDYLFPKDPKDLNAWVRDMARVIFGAVLRSRRWDSIQEISRTLRKTRLEPFLAMLDPIYLDTMKEPKSQVPVLQDLVVALSRWETERVRSITEGRSTVTLDDFITKGGYVMNCEDSDALKVPVHVFWAMLLGRLRNRPQGSSKILLLMDEFGDCGRIPGIEKSLVLLRTRGVAILAAIQNLGLLQNVYPHEWKAVMKGFGSRVWLARNLEDELRQQLSTGIGKYTRRVPPANKNANETDKEADLMPLDAWARWSELRVALGRLHGYTYWFPVPIEIPDTPLGKPVAAVGPWEEAKALAKEALQEVTPEDWKPEPIPVPGDLVPTQVAAEALVLPTGEDWL